MTDDTQIPLDLLPPHQPTLDNFVPGCNAPALAALREVAAGRGAQFVYLWGGVGSGRSHLLASLGPDAVPGPWPGPVPAYAPSRRLYRVDDVHRLDPDGQAALFALQIEVGQAPEARLVAAGDRPPAQLALREDVRTRLAWGLVFELLPLSESEQAAALLAYAASRGARVDPELVPYMLTRLPRDMRTLTAVVEALDGYALARRR
ncbi:MAG: DnaA regulatory inactivator Hda, partial [Acidobacteria bacterium]|nr:DnaA regulatory inactivator Hda [Acidobacteriota bacterium]